MLNCVTLQGRLTENPELRFTPKKVAFTGFTIAADRSYVKQGEERQTDFFNIIAWNQTAEFICKYFHKGQMMVVQGELQTRSFTDKQGIKRKVFEVLASKAHFGGDKKEENTTIEGIGTDENTTEGWETDDGWDDDLPF